MYQWVPSGSWGTDAVPFCSTLLYPTSTSLYYRGHEKRLSDRHCARVCCQGLELWSPVALISIIEINSFGRSYHPIFEWQRTEDTTADIQVYGTSCAHQPRWRHNASWKRNGGYLHSVGALPEEAELPGRLVLVFREKLGPYGRIRTSRLMVNCGLACGLSATGTGQYQHPYWRIA